MHNYNTRPRRNNSRNGVDIADESYTIPALRTDLYWVATGAGGGYGFQAGLRRRLTGIRLLQKAQVRQHH